MPNAAQSTPPPAMTPSPPDSQVQIRRRREPPTGRLTPAEAKDLEYLWHGYEADLGARSVHGAIEDRLRRSVPKLQPGRVLEELDRLGGRAQMAQLVDLLALERVATRHEVRSSVFALLGADRPKLAIDEAGELRRLPHVVGSRRTREERWRAADEELERGWRELVCGEDVVVAGEVQMVGTAKRVRPVLDALAAIGREHALTLRSVHGARAPAARYDAFGELAGLAERTPTVVRLRREKVERRVRERGETYRREVETEVTTLSIVLDGLDGAGGSVEARTRRSSFVRAVVRNAEAMILAACVAYRAARAR